MNHASFIENVGESLTRNGWKDLQKDMGRFDLSARREDAVTAVTVRRLIVFLKGDGLSREEIKKAVEEAHETASRNAVSPLFPANNIVVFVFGQPTDTDWIVAKAHKRDILKSNHTVSWVVNLSKKSFTKNKGRPIVRSGEAEIREALNASS